jgi:hypothetical protein
MQDVSNTTGGVITWRSSTGSGPGSNYCYMIRCNNHQLQMHFNGAVNTGLSLSIDTVYKIEISGSNYSIKDLINSTTYTGTNSTTRGMGTRMASIAAYSDRYDEMGLDKFFGIAGIARATTDAEDLAIKDALMNQSL